MAIKLHELIETGTLWAILIGAALYFMCSGCTVKLNDNGSVFCRFGTTIEFGHETSTTNAESEATTAIAGEFLRSIGLWKEKGEITDEELLEAFRMLVQANDSVPVSELLDNSN